jgi:uncharacterized protein (TIGR02757 family)
LKLTPNLIAQLEFYADKFNQAEFIKDDPISIPSRFSIKQDIEIAAFLTATISWGNRKSIINSATKIIAAMDNDPWQFVLNHRAKDLIALEKCGHRTFNATDLLYFIAFLKNHYAQENTLETAFLKGKTMEEKLIKFNQYFFNLPFAPNRTQKHVASPAKKSACKRLNMFLRWMVRKDDKGVDFGIWKNINTADLIIPLDVHVVNSVSELFKIKPMKPNWQSALEITGVLKQINPQDPVLYDYALFGYGVSKKK